MSTTGMSNSARRGSQSSSSSISMHVEPSRMMDTIISDNYYSSIDTSSCNQFRSTLRSISGITTSWLEHSWSPINTRYERIAVGSPNMGVAIMITEMMEMHTVQSPNTRGMVDCLPVADRHGFAGWRQKLGTWPLSKHEARTSKQFEA